MSSVEEFRNKIISPPEKYPDGITYKMTMQKLSKKKCRKNLASVLSDIQVMAIDLVLGYKVRDVRNEDRVLKELKKIDPKFVLAELPTGVFSWISPATGIPQADIIKLLPING